MVQNIFHSSPPCHNPHLTESEASSLLPWSDGCRTSSRCTSRCSSGSCSNPENIVIVIHCMSALSSSLPITGYGGARTPSNFLRSSVYIICACSRLFFSSSVLAASDRISVSASSLRPCNDHESVILLTVWQKWKRVWSLIGGKDTHEEFRNASLLTSPSPNSNPAPNPKESNPKRFQGCN